MKKINSIFAVVFLACSLTVGAQELKSSYFIKSSNYRHELNPAFMGEKGYVSFPALGNINVGTQSNVGLNDFVYKTNDPSSKYDLTTFMSPTVNSEDFLGSIKGKNRINANFGITLFSIGIKSKNGFSTFEARVKSNTQAILPYSLFDFMKTGMGKSYYDLKDLAVRSNTYVEISVGHAHQINSKLNVGAKLKVLVGAANAEAKFDKLDVSLTDDKWEAHSQGTLDLGLSGASFKTDNQEGWVNNLHFDKAGVAGMGGAVDLGATYQFNDAINFSASLIDLGFMTWNKNLQAKSDATFTFDGFKNIAIDPESGDENSIDNQWDGIKDNLEELGHFYPQKDAKTRTEMLSTTMNLGASYILPYYQKLTFGFLSSTRFAGEYTSTYAMLSANVSPLSWIDASANYSLSSYGSSIGGMLSLHPGPLTLFIGTDCIFTRVTPQYIPVHKANANVNFGLGITF